MNMGQTLGVKNGRGLAGLVFLFSISICSAASAGVFYDAIVSQANAALCGPDPTSLADHTQPGAVKETCGSAQSIGSAGAFAEPGHIGGSADIAVFDDGSHQFASDESDARAEWQDTVLVTGGPVGSTTASLNFAVAADLGGLGSIISFARTNFTISVGTQGWGIDYFHSTFGDYCSTTVDFVCSGVVLNAGSYTTPVIEIPVGTPFDLAFILEVTASAEGIGASASADASHSLDLILDHPVFNFTDPGYTANVGDYIVNNVFVGAGPGPTGVPEPGTIAFLGAGLAVLAMLRRSALRGGTWYKGPCPSPL